MILKNYKDRYGEWHDACILEDFDIDMFKRGPFADAVDLLKRVLRFDVPVNPHAWMYPYTEQNGTVNSMLSMLRNRYSNLKNEFFASNYAVNAINANNQYCFHKDSDDAQVKTDTELVKTEQSTSTAIDNWEALLSTRRIVAMTGATLYDGPEFKFKSNRRESPAAGAIDGLAKDYTMNVLIPNALLAMHLLGKKANAYWNGNCFATALRYCMTTGKSQKSIDAWYDYIESTEGKAVVSLWNKYVANVDAEGNRIDAEHQWYFKKFIDLRCKSNTTKFRKSKNYDELQKLLERMSTEPELKTASRRRLIELGCSDTLARQFMKARELKPR